MSRTVTLLLVDPAGTPLGALPPYDVPMPYWQEASDVVAGARERYGIEVTVLRLLHTQRPVPHGGGVIYLAEVDAPPAVPLAPADVDLTGHPARAPWAVPGGPRAALAWAVATLADLGRPAAVPVQQRTWNLSAIWRLDTDGAPTAWLKQVPAFFAHEAAVVRFLAGVAPGLGPTLLAAGPDGCLLLDHIRGDDCYDAGDDLRDAMAADVHPVQVAAAGRVDELLAAGVPDRRPARLAELIRWVVAEHGAERPALRPLVDGLDGRLAAVTACGLPDTLVHGDLHPGNVRSDGTRRVVLDWGDACVGHPGFDILRLTEGLPAPRAAALIAAWAGRWRAAVPGCDPERAVTLLRPVAALRNAVVYARFLRSIEPTEWPYHAADVPAWLDAALDAAR